MRSRLLLLLTGSPLAAFFFLDHGRDVICLLWIEHLLMNSGRLTSEPPPFNVPAQLVIEASLEQNPT